MDTTDVQGTLREMWETRPARSRQDRQVVGVAAAVARRYDIDPVLVRVGFVVAAVTGSGAALYLAGWLLLPEAPVGPGDPARARPPRKILLVGLVIAAVAGVGSLFDGDVDGGGILGTLAAVGLLFLLHRRRRDRLPAPAPEAPPATVSLRKELDGAPTPPAWDPLGVAPFAWDLPEPSPPATPRPRRTPVTAVTLGVALLAGGITTGVLLLAGAFSPENLPVLLGVVLAVLGCGLLVGAFVRAGRGLIPIALLLSVLTWAAVAAPPDRWHHGTGELRAAPTTVAALLPVYERGAGEIELDLRDLDLAVPPGGSATPVRTSVSVGAGDVQVWVPADADLTLRGSVGFGEVSFAGDEESGPGSELAVTEDLGADGVRSGRLLVLDVEAGAGDVEVRRG